MATKNLAKNGTFEEQNDVWTFDGPASIVNDGHAMSGQKCLRFVNSTAGGQQSAFQFVSVKPGTTCNMSFWAKRTGRMDIWASVGYFIGDGADVIQGPSMLNSIGETYSLQRWSFTVPAGALSPVLVFIRAGGNAGDSASAWVDNVEFWGEEFVPQLPDPGPHPSGITHLENGNFESGNAAWQFTSPSQVVTDSSNAKEGSKVLKFPYRAAAGMQGVSQSVRLVPGKTYILSFYAKRSGRMDVWAAYSYIDAGGSRQLVHGPSMLNAIPDTNTYRRQQYYFTIPSGASGPYTIYINGGNTPGDTNVAGYIDDAVLVNTDGSAPPPPPFEEKYGYVVNVNSAGLKVRSAPGEDEKPYTLAYGEEVFIHGEQTHSGIHWYHITDRLGRDGWVQSQYISLSNPGQSEGQKYVQVTVNNASVRTQSGDGINSDQVFPQGRILIAEDAGATLYSIRYRGLPRYIRKSDCAVLSQSVPGDIIERIRTIAAPEVGRNDSKYFDGYTGSGYDWCHRFADWLYLSAQVPLSLVPNTAGTAEGIRFFIQDYQASGGIGETFWFVNETLKNNFLNKYTQIDIPHGLTDDEKAFSPQEGDYIYFRLDNRPDSEVVSHVGYVTAVAGGRVYTIEGNVNNTVVRKDYDLKSLEILGYGRPLIPRG